MKSSEFITESWDAPLVKMVDKLAKENGMKVDAQATIYDMVSSNNFKPPLSKEDVATYWKSYAEHNKLFDPEAASLRQKVAYLYREGVINGEFYVDDVVDDLKREFGGYAETLSLKEIAKFIKGGEYELTGEL